jgi:hypothetical protein
MSEPELFFASEPIPPVPTWWPKRERWRPSKGVRRRPASQMFGVHDGGDRGSFERDRSKINEAMACLTTCPLILREGVRKAMADLC